jgi:hypothetical protein
MQLSPGHDNTISELGLIDCPMMTEPYTGVVITGYRPSDDYNLTYSNSWSYQANDSARRLCHYFFTQNTPSCYYNMS